MVSRYPHKLIYSAPGSEDVYDENTGQYIPGTPGVQMEVSCRARPNGAGNKKPNKDGVLTDYSYDLGIEYDPAFSIAQNAQVQIIGVNGQVMFTGELQGYQIGNASILGWI